MTTAAGAIAPWRFAARLARREVRRHPGRTILVALLVAVPIAGMTVASILARTFDSTTWVEREFGLGTDLTVSQFGQGDLDIDELLPVGSSAFVAQRAQVGIETADGSVVDWLEIIDGTRSGTHSPIRTDAGREPAEGEVWLTTTVADDLDVDVGDVLSLRHPAGTWTVVGIGEGRSDDGRRTMVMPDLPVDQFRDGVVERLTLVDLPASLSPSEMDAVSQRVNSRVNVAQSAEGDASSWANWTSYQAQDDLAPLAWTWVIGTIALAATGIIVTAAFATSARRQLAMIGIMSANGSSERLTRRALAAQGAWTGLAGSVVGVGTGLSALVFGRSLIERINGGELGEYRIGVLYLVLIGLTGVGASTVAALVPARTASKVPVMAALAGRRPLGKVPPRLVPRGIGIAVLGLLLLVLGAMSRDGGAVPTFAATLGAVFVLIGMCCCSPLAVDWMGRACGRLSGAWRLAGRGLGRTRTRSAAVVTAIAVIGAITVAASATVVASEHRDDVRFRQLPSDAVMLVPERTDMPTEDRFFDLGPERPEPVPGELASAVEAAVPSAQWHTRRIATWDPAPFDTESAGDQGTHWWRFVVADEAMMDLLELSDADRDALDRAGVLVRSPWSVSEAFFGGVPSELEVPTESGVVVLDVGFGEEVFPAYEDPGYAFRGIQGNGDLLITEQAAAAAGFEIVERGGFIRSDKPLTSAQRDAISSAVWGSSPRLADVYVDLRQTETVEGMSPWSPIMDYPPDGDHGAALQAGIAAIALVLTLLVVAIGLALAAAEGAAERDVLVAVGGRPQTMRSMAAVKAFVLTVTGLLLAVPFGLLPTYAVMRAAGTTFLMPWLTLGLLVLVVPLLAGAISWLVSAVGQRIRPVQISTLAFD